MEAGGVSSGDEFYIRADDGRQRLAQSAGFFCGYDRSQSLSCLAFSKKTFLYHHINQMPCYRRSRINKPDLRGR